ncbi:hypothetical protein SteCoe_32674 [Stentor coeruleus]|uniref:rRNA methyltransferase 2, mitochondrial n=1 Tax=Stentor coeruleus TaxID=5963 RepID=A0A1R2AYH3_9CILI|nr:hypothetical protein SteCoe_32674 [Stentor coeruleus]
MISRRMFSSWMQRHVSDGYVKQSAKDGYRSRSAYKLIEMNQKVRLFKLPINILDLGSSPGGWSQVVLKFISKNPDSKLTSVDILPMNYLHGCSFLQLDMLKESSIDEIIKHTGQNVDLILSDMSSNHSGMTDFDCLSLTELNNSVLHVSKKLLKPGGNVLMKMLMGASEPEHYKSISNYFTKVIRVKPNASRKESKEFYYYCTGWKVNIL